MIRRLLIANRGEIAIRIARTARRLGIETVAIASAADRDAPHTRAADRLVKIGGERAVDSYLRGDLVVAAARAADADAVHPGYGFLSESAAFAEAVLAAGLLWVGPPPAAMRAMADKAAARRRVAAAGVPVLPGSDADDPDRATLRGAALRLGVPLMVKAVAGGGGRGMRLVEHIDRLDAALDAAATEAEAAFGDPRLLLERALQGARHVEIQVVADMNGDVIHLGERDCSVQRRHQKLIEEAPSPAVSPALRRAMGAVAVDVAREVGYRGAGTIEFLLDGDGAFWFIEMNTRLQVEHPVTEALLGVDLVEWQLGIAAGRPLPLTQAEALRRYEAGGHAIEARLCAEDPARGDLPQAGRIVRWSVPAGLRCDHAVASGSVVSPHYDSMLAKLIVHASTRAEATGQLAAALDRTVCLGLPTNRAFLAALLRHDAFRAGAMTTDFLATRLADDATRSPSAPPWLEALAAAAIALLPRQPLPALWAGWSSSPVVDVDLPLGLDERRRRWQLHGRREDIDAAGPSGRHRIAGLRQARDGRSDGVGIDGGENGGGGGVRSDPAEGGEVEAEVDGRPVRATFAREGDASWWQAEGHEIAVVDQRLRARDSVSAGADGQLLAPMHGRVTQVLVTAGAAVDAGAVLLVLEAMKMEHPVRAPRAGVVGALHVWAGDQVAARQPLVDLQP